ncbi:RHS repeat-associated core domain-containing protein, partial [Pseudomonas moorei]|uniref:RHS repeat-associated core domain-containing protein n=1 Tax=Pseudomonas moorei TaxID=395599 RepID=UPI00200D0E78
TSTLEEEELHVISVVVAGRQQVRVLYWEAGRRNSMPNDQLRGNLDNQIGSSLFELDQKANVLTLEEYFLYGGTAVWSGKTASKTQYKSARYSSRERDATGLYYYGFRCYVPWLGRWINPDPAGSVDGLNLYRMVRNNPVIYVDNDGLQPIPLVVHFVWEGANISTGALRNTPFIKYVNPEYEVDVWMPRLMSIYSTLDKMFHLEDAPYERYFTHRHGS